MLLLLSLAPLHADEAIFAKGAKVNVEAENRFGVGPLLRDVRAEFGHSGCSRMVAVIVAPAGDRPGGWGGDAAVFSGMMLFGIFLTPLFYFVIQWMTGSAAPTATPGAGAGHATQTQKDGVAVG